MNEQPANEINDTAPTSLNHLIGQQAVINQITVALDAAQIDSQRFPHSMLVGPPGMGKSATANVIAQEMAAGFHEVLGQSLSHVSDLNALLLAAQDRDVVHLDEAHEIPKPMQTALYLALDKRQLNVGGKGKSPQVLPLADFTLLVSTTDEYGLLQPLRDRCRLLLRFDYYSTHDLASVLVHRSRSLGWPVGANVIPRIAGMARGTPRIALRLLQSCRRVCRAEGEDEITETHLDRACQLEQIDSLGLGPTEQRYLEILAGGSTRLNVIATMLGLPTRTVSEVVEAFLIRVGLVMKDDQGRRQLTAKGHHHLAKLRQQTV